MGRMKDYIIGYEGAPSHVRRQMRHRNPEMFGTDCPACEGTGKVDLRDGTDRDCRSCEGLGTATRAANAPVTRPSNDYCTDCRGNGLRVLDDDTMAWCESCGGYGVANGRTRAGAAPKYEQRTGYCGKCEGQGEIRALVTPYHYFGECDRCGGNGKAPLGAECS